MPIGTNSGKEPVPKGISSAKEPVPNSISSKKGDHASMNSAAIFTKLILNGEEGSNERYLSSCPRFLVKAK